MGERRKKGSSTSTAMPSEGTANFIDILIAILLPPLGVFLKFGCHVKLNSDVIDMVLIIIFAEFVIFRLNSGSVRRDVKGTYQREHQNNPSNHNQATYSFFHVELA
ncbi:Low temperature and salt responsive protein family [Prunus dulcis]|uniref:Low temperature and salt responsive protein family n=1 Tax=Prunus dulcis TaxID=3755 RepID=A0A5H2XKF9_PRUDU|nr:Low temperature and salt responsive protein family [Prunus dulcis]